MNEKILICDDSSDILEVTSMILEVNGYQPLTELQSIGLIERAILEKPDVLLLDLWMPVLPGDELAKAIRATPELARLPIILFSAAIDGHHRATEAGADYFICKPYDMNELLQTVEAALSKYRSGL